MDYLYIIKPFVNPVDDTLNKLLGPSIFLLILDLFLEQPDQMMNLREIARQVNILQGCKVGKVTIIYQLNHKNPKIKTLQEMRKRLQE
jgi:uncharacterized membrane protein